MTILEQIRHRKSVRTYNGEPLSREDQKKIMDFAGTVRNPFGLDITFRLLNAKESGLSSPVIVGADCYLAGKLRREPHAAEAFGYSFERIVLYADALGIGTVWIGGTMNRSAFERAMEVRADEVMPCVSPLGYPAEKRSLRETMMRSGIKADTRMAFGDLFYEGDFSVPLAEGRFPELDTALEAVRLAPSAVNKQPWRIVTDGKTAHFYEKHSRGYTDSSGWDMQRIDIGIAMAHFELGTGDRQLHLTVQDPGIKVPEQMEYIASWTI